MQQVVLESSDKKRFVVDVQIAQMFNAVRIMLEHLGMESNMEPIPILNVTSEILKLVIQWAEYHRHDPQVPDDQGTDEICQWDQTFLQIDQGTLFELILAANFLDIKGLLDVTCKTVANKIKGKNPEEIRQVLNIRNDYSQAEEEHVRMQAD